MTDPGFIMGQLLSIFGDEIEVFKHKGYADSGDDFWHKDQDWESSGTTYNALVEDEPSDEALNQPGFADEAESAIWTKQPAAEEGDKIEYQSREYLVVSVSDYRQGGSYGRQLIGVKTINT